MRKILFGALVWLPAACLSPTDTPPSPKPLPGVYRGDHGTTWTRGLESELILDSHGAFRFFLIDSNTAFYTAKGEWKATEKEMVWSRTSRSYLYHGGFRVWDTLAFPDTSYLRKVSDSGFERLEVASDSHFVSVLRWVEYRRIPPMTPLAAGMYEFRETYRDGVDTAVIDTGLTRLDISRDGPYVQRLFQNSKPTFTDSDSFWTQAGTFLITSRNHHCAHEDGKDICSDAPDEYEYVARLDRVTQSAFRLWIAPDFTFQPEPFWAAFSLEP